MGQQRWLAERVPCKTELDRALLEEDFARETESIEFRWEDLFRDEAQHFERKLAPAARSAGRSARRPCWGSSSSGTISEWYILRIGWQSQSLQLARGSRAPALVCSRSSFGRLGLELRSTARESSLVPGQQRERTESKCAHVTLGRRCDDMVGGSFLALSPSPLAEPAQGPSRLFKLATISLDSERERTASGEVEGVGAEKKIEPSREMRASGQHGWIRERQR